MNKKGYNYPLETKIFLHLRKVKFVWQYNYTIFKEKINNFLYKIIISFIILISCRLRYNNRCFRFNRKTKKQGKQFSIALPAFYGRGDETRTHDLLVPNQARYQLRYTSNFQRLYII